MIIADTLLIQMGHNVLHLLRDNGVVWILRIHRGLLVRPRETMDAETLLLAKVPPVLQVLIHLVMAVNLMKVEFVRLTQNTVAGVLHLTKEVSV